MIHIKKLSKSETFKDDETLEITDLSLVLTEKTGLICITGDRNSGHHVLFYTMGGVIQADSGEFILGNQSNQVLSIHDWKKYCHNQISLVSPIHPLIQGLSYHENLELECIANGYENEALEKKIIDLLKQVGLEDYNNQLTNHPNELKERIPLARALVRNTPILMIDEITTNFNQEATKRLFTLLKELSKKRLIIMKTSHKDLSFEFADRVIEMKDGRIMQNTTKTLPETTHFNSNDKINEDESSEQVKLTHSPKIPLKYVLKMSIPSGTHLKVSLINLFLFTCIVVFSTIIINFSSYNAEKFTANTLDQINIHGFVVSNKNREPIDQTYLEDLMTEYPNIALYKSYDKQNRNIYYDDYFNRITIVDDSNPFIGLVEGEYPTQVGEVLVTDYMAKNIYDRDSVTDLSNIVGRVLLFHKPLTITGIVATDYPKHNKKDVTKSIQFQIEQSLYYQQIFMSQETYDDLSVAYTEVNIYKGPVDIGKQVVSKPILYNTVYLYGRLPELDNEMLITSTQLINFFKDEVNYQGFINEEDVLEKKITLALEASSGYTIEKEFTITGYINDTYRPVEFDYMFTQTIFDDLYAKESPTSKTNIQSVTAYLGNNEQENIKFLEAIDQANYQHESIYSKNIYEVRHLVDHYPMVIKLILLIIIPTIILIGSYYLSPDRLKPLKQMGYSRLERLKPFMIEIAITSIVVFVTSVMGSIYLMKRLFERPASNYVYDTLSSDFLDLHTLHYFYIRNIYLSLIPLTILIILILTAHVLKSPRK